jgi:hypothetical protein
MDIKHRITVNSSDKNFISSIMSMGVEHKAFPQPVTGGQLITIFIFESDPHWDNVVQLVKSQEYFEIYGIGDQFETTFSEAEIRQAEWLRLISTFEQGYPQPKLHWPIKQLSYEITCPKCAIYKQTHPMRLAKEPTLGRKSFMTTTWAAEVFCTPQAIMSLDELRMRGYEAWDVLLHRTSEPLEKVRQLYIPGVAFPGVIIEDDLERHTCPVCGVTKYYPHMKGAMRFKREALLSDTDFMLTHEWFGVGYLAWREMLVSNRVASLVLDKDWSGVRFKVVELV